MSFDMPPDEPPDELSYTKYELEQMTAERDRLQAEVKRLREAIRKAAIALFENRVIDALQILDPNGATLAQSREVEGE